MAAKKRVSRSRKHNKQDRDYNVLLFGGSLYAPICAHRIRDFYFNHHCMHALTW